MIRFKAAGRARIAVCAWVLLAASGCATMRDSLLLGLGSGAAVGVGVGAGADSSNPGRGALIGAGVGAVVGAGAAYLIKNGLDSRDAETRKETLFNLERFGVSEVPHQGSSVPAISFPVVGEEKIETHRQGNKVIEGHHVWILGDDSHVEYTGPEEGGKSSKDGKTRKGDDK